MSNWINEFNGAFWISIATILIGFFGLAIRHCLKSKCENFSLCCGMVSIQRRVDLEVEEELAQMEMGIPSTPDKKHNNSI